ncbi:hypothetical protein B484DRAFT_445476 [Ochromonadaceae sp. CCMP2298]|nr:hypothetical protein B484DRAFT_445476 [Ochromonadaceae sp. CCMP2298]
MRVPTAMRYTILFTAGMASMLGGASVVHNIFQPDTRIPEFKVAPTAPMAPAPAQTQGASGSSGPKRP